MKRILLAAMVITLSACTTFSTQQFSKGIERQLPQTIGEKESGFTYIPLDPMPVTPLECEKGFTPRTLLDSLPDNTVRIVVKEFDAKGNLSFGPASTGVEGHQYQIVLDYINSDITNIWFVMKEEPPPLNRFNVTRVDKLPNAAEADDASILFYGGIPVYIGVGLRLIADLKVNRGNINLSSLGAIAAAVEAGNASGSLVVQTLGITGKQVSTALPLPSELNQTTVQNAILSLGAVKAMVNNDKSLVITPRVVGMYLPLTANTKVVNLIMSELASTRIPWKQSCERKVTH